MLWQINLVICLVLTLLISLTLFPCAILVETRGNTAANTLLLFVNTILVLRDKLSIINHILLRSAVLHLLHLVMLLQELKLRVSRSWYILTILVKKIKDNWLINHSLVEVIVHDEHSSVRHEHYTLEHILVSGNHSSSFICHDETSSWLNLASLLDLLSGTCSQRILLYWVRWRLDSCHCLINGLAWTYVLNSLDVLSVDVRFLDLEHSSFRLLHACNFTWLQRKDTVVFKPEEHDLLEVALSSFK